jgi:hypothetical protein
MPRVTTYGGRKVATEALPGVRKTAAETPGSTGVGLADAETRAALKKGQAAGQKAEAMAGFGGTVAKVGGYLLEQQAKDREHDDTVALVEAENYLKRWETDRLYNPEKGALTQKGKDALTLPEQIDTEFTELTGEIEKGLNPRQLAKWQAIKGDAGVNLHTEIMRHVFTQTQAYEGKELQDRIVNGTKLAIANATDPRRIGVELDGMKDAVNRMAPQLGLGPEQIKAQIEKITTATHVGVIDRLLTNEQTKQAQIYFEETKGEIAGDALAGVEKALEEGSLRKESQRKADAIIAKGGTLTEQRAAVKEIEDPKLRDEVQQRVEHEAAIKEREDREAEEATLTSSYNTVDQSHDVRSIPPATWANLPGSAKSALRSYAEHLAKGVPVETDLPTYYALMQQAASEPETFLSQNLLNYKAKLDEVEFKQLAGLQLSIRSGDRNKADKDLAGFLTHKQILDNTLAQYGIPTEESKQSTAQKSAVAQLQRMLDRRVEAAQSKGQKVTNVEIQQTLDDLLSQGETVPGSWWNIWPGGKSVSDTTKRLIDLTPADIPADVRQRIETRLRARNRPVSDATVLDVYLEMQVK